MDELLTKAIDSMQFASGDIREAYGAGGPVERIILEKLCEHRQTR